MNLKLIFFSSLFFSTIFVNGQDLNNCVEGILNNHYEEALLNAGNYKEKIQKYRTAVEQKNRFTEKTDSLVRLITGNAKFSGEEKMLFKEIVHLSINNVLSDVYTRVRECDQKSILKLNTIIPLSYLYELERDYEKQKIPVVIEECKRWAIDVCKFSLNAINYYNADKKRIPDTIFKHEIQCYQFKNNEVIADIGAGSGYFEKAISKYSDRLTVYVNDIDSVKHLDLATKLAFLNLNDEKDISYITILGEERSTHLKPVIFDKILIRNSFHHFTFPNEMLQEIKQLIKKDGKLFIVDILLDEVEKPPHCKFHITRKDLLNYLTSNGFHLVHETDLQYDNFKCLEFQLISDF